MIQQDFIAPNAFLRGVSPLAQVNLDTAFVSQIIDMRDLMSMAFVIILGALTDAGFTTVVLMEHGDTSNLADAAAVPDAELLPSGTGQEAAAAFTEANDDQIRTIGYAGIKRYVRLTITPTGNGAGTINIAVLATGRRRIAGVTN
jgi:hypothetical protein